MLVEQKFTPVGPKLFYPRGDLEDRVFFHTLRTVCGKPKSTGNWSSEIAKDAKCSSSLFALKNLVFFLFKMSLFSCVIKTLTTH